MKFLFYLSVLFLTVNNAQASMLELNGAYLSDIMSTSTTVTTTRMNYDFAVGIHLGTKKRYYIALSYGSLATSDAATTTTTFTSQDTGIKLGWLMGKDKNWFLTATYNFIAKAAYKDAATSEVELRGTSLRADVGYLAWIDETIAFGIKIIYYAPSFSESVLNTTITKVSYSRTTIMPGLGLYWEY